MLKAAYDDAVAKIGDVYYATLQAAADAAADGETVVLLKDVTLAQRVDVNASGKSIAIDLGGKTVTPTATCGNGSAFDVKSGTVAIKNGKIDGSAITQTAEQAATAANECDPITARSGAVVTLSGLEVTIDSVTGACAYAFDGASITIEGGTYTNLADEAYPYNADFTGMTVNQANVASQLVHVKGGTFVGNDPQLGDDSGKARLVEPGYVALPAEGTTAGQNGTYTVSKANAILL